MSNVTNIFGSINEMYTIDGCEFSQKANMAIEDHGGADEFTLSVFISPQEVGDGDMDGYYCYAIYQDGPVFLADGEVGLGLFSAVDEILEILHMGGANMEGIIFHVKY